jgi:8-oxo-dGTP pyrophosphatase MutT (NUDIX family)
VAKAPAPEVERAPSPSRLPDGTRATRILDPRSVPVAGADTHLPRLAESALTAQALAERFERLRRGGDWQPELTGDGRAGDSALSSAAAVLVPMVQTDSGLRVLLTQRTDHLRHHAGQISFPGGRTEPTDADAAATALREAEEEVGLSRSRVQVIGRMPPYITVTGYIVTPVVGLVTAPFDLSELVLDRGEVAEAFAVPLPFLMDPANHRRHVVQFEGGQRQFLSMPWQGQGEGGVPREYFIWGATAAMLRNLYRLLAG